MGKLYCKIDDPQGWTGELARQSCQRFLLHGNVWPEVRGSTVKMLDSSGNGNHGVVENFQQDQIITTMWGKAINLSAGTYGKVPYKRGMWPTGGTGSFAVSAWINMSYGTGRTFIMGNRGNGDTSRDPRLFEIYASKNTAGASPTLNADFFSGDDRVVATMRVTTFQLSEGGWSLVTLSMDYDTATARLEFFNARGGNGVTTLSIPKSSLNLDPVCAFVFGGEGYFSAMDEVVLYNPVPAGESVLNIGLTCGGATGGDDRDLIRIVHHTLDSQEPNAMQGSGLPVGRVAPNPGLSMGSGGLSINTRWVPFSRIEPLQGARILVDGRNVRIGTRTDNMLTRVWGTTWHYLTNGQGCPIPYVDNPSTDKWMQFQVNFTRKDAYLDSLHVVQDHSNSNYNTSDLPKNTPVPAFELSPVQVDTKDGGLILDEELLRCVTVDTDDLESTLEFDLPLQHPKAQYIGLEDPVTFRGHHYTVRAVTSQDSRAEPKLKVYCERRWYDLLYAGELSKTHWGLTAEECAMLIMADSPDYWQLGIVEDPTAQHEWELPPTSTRIGALKELAKQYALEISINDHEGLVHLLKQAGRDSGVTFLYDRDVSTATRQVDTINLLTRIYGLNEIGGDITPANGGVPYLEDRTWTSITRQMTYHFSGAQTPQAMKTFLQTYLATRARPRVSYSFELAALGSRLRKDQAFEVGDYVTVRDENLNQILRARVVEARMDWCHLEEGRITLDTKLNTLSSKI